MVDKIKFMEMLADIAEVAKISNNELTQDEIKGYFKDIELEDSHFEHIYAYLAENNIKVIGFIHQLSISKNEESTEINKEDSAYVKMYLEDLRMISLPSKEEEKLLFMQLINGSEEAKKTLMENQLKIVVDLAYEYRNKGLIMEDLIQEGNIALINGLESLKGSKDVADGKDALTTFIKEAMVEVIDKEIYDEDWENTVLAKTNLINEATRYLAENLGRVANIHELSAYSKLSEKEIQNILDISANVIEVGKCDHNH
jgi:RNA polymerase primary sigma factor